MEQGAWSKEHGAWSKEHGAWSKEHGAWSKEHGAWSKERKQLSALRDLRALVVKMPYALCHSYKNTLLLVHFKPFMSFVPLVII